jgi:hypothetical protein
MQLISFTGGGWGEHVRDGGPGDVAAADRFDGALDIELVANTSRFARDADWLTAEMGFLVIYQPAGAGGGSVPGGGVTGWNGSDSMTQIGFSDGIYER